MNLQPYKRTGMDIVYVLGTGSLWKNNELRYSLRSIQKYLNGFGKIFIVGECPEWITGIVHLPCQDIPKRKEWSIMNKIMCACNSELVSNDFIFFNDDHFLLKPVDVADINYWYSCSLVQKAIISNGPNKSKAVNTMEVIDPESPFYDIHTPMIYNKQEFRKIMLNPAINWHEKDYLVKTLYANMSSLDSVDVYRRHMKDCKISVRMGYDMIRDKIKDRVVFSIGPAAVKADLKRVLNELYPDQSIYEQ